MAKRRSIFLFMLSLVIAGGAAWVANNWLLAKMAPPANAATLPVATAAINIAQNQQISPDDVKLVDMPPNLIPASAIRDPDQIIGKFATQSIFPGELIFEGRLVDSLEKPSLKAVTNLVKPDLRALAIQIDSVIGMGTFVRPGVQVDVLATRKIERVRLRRNKPSTIATIVQNVRVLSVDQSSLPNDNDPLMNVRAVTLEVSPYQAEILAAASDGWSLTIAIRPVES